jgi:hypothetical protein
MNSTEEEKTKAGRITSRLISLMLDVSLDDGESYLR